MVFVGKVVCSVNVLYMELSYTGSLDWSTRASEHVTLQCEHRHFIWAATVDWFVIYVNVLYMELSYITGLLNWSTRAS